MLGTAPADVYRNRFRLKRFTRFIAIADEIIARNGTCRIIDVGGNMEHWNALSDLWSDRAIHVTLINLTSEEVLDARFVSIAASACDLSQFKDLAFDLVYSNSVIEHVGNWSNQKRMAAEIRRIAPRHYVQTPNFWFPIEPHFRTPFIHWLPEPWRVGIVRARACGFYPRAKNVDEAREILADAQLLDAAAMAELFPDSVIERERFVLTKSLIAVR
ncbi:class I SAM-dependent methyltransferase [Rhodopseudomonas sp. HC1]|uniref:methyltransferase domain-containing protein n=1 Tax=Rhodopseudomonas infernalis TaxID=2897386 RepID=UPI001EE9634E|nr:methyltransferase domain-containing protein [Rhodopseudomonas infernalis]MCG6203117.1 class I SAM-dependent methyltransferase [Rhodopseudomonas infernalis]